MEWSSACLIPLAYIIVEAIFIDGSNRNTRFYIIFLCGIGSVLELSFFVSFIQYQYSCTKKNTQKIKAKDTKLNKKHKTKHKTKQNKKQKNKNKNQLQDYKCHLPSNGFVQSV